MILATASGEHTEEKEQRVYAGAVGEGSSL
jgi:hypothetical protein